jgi:PII-like signaling protein
MSYIRDVGVLVKVFVSEDDRYRGERLYRAIVSLAQNMQIRGATVIRGFEGFGISTDIHSQQNLRMSEDLPIMINFVDKRDRLEPFVDKVAVMLGEANAQGLISVSATEMICPPNS